ncbi:MAG: hypothetical protein ABW170_17925 [Candidatus Thiodiazotropha sp. L084R]
MGMGISAEFTLFEDKKDFMLETEGSGWVEIGGNELYPGFFTGWVTTGTITNSANQT